MAEEELRLRTILAESRWIHAAIEGMSRFEAKDWLTQDLMSATALNKMDALEIVRM